MELMMRINNFQLGKEVTVLQSGGQILAMVVMSTWLQKFCGTGTLHTVKL